MSIDPSKVPVRFLNIAYHFLEEKNYDTNELWDLCGITPSSLCDELTVVPIDSFIQSFDLIEKYRKTAEPLSCIIRRFMPLTYLGQFGHTLLAGRYISNGLNLIENYLNQATPMTATFNREGDFIRLQVEGCQIYREYSQIFNEVTLMKIQDYISFCTGSFYDSTLQLKHNGSDENIVNWSKEKINFGFENNSILINTKTLNTTSPIFDENLFNTNIKRFFSYKYHQRDSSSLSDKVKHILKRSLKEGVKPNSSYISGELNCSERKMSRILKIENTSFQLLLDECIAQRAQLLILNNCPLKTVAFELGFKSVAGMSSAFKRCHGITPKEFKENSRFLNTFYCKKCE